MHAKTIPLTAVVLLALLTPAAVAAGSKFKKAEFKAAYLETLERYARGESVAAANALVELESDALLDSGGRVEPLWKAKLSAVRDLLRAGPELLVPVAELHERAYLLHLSNRAHALAAHSRTLTVELAELYAERLEGSRGRRYASAVMTSLAGHLHAAFMDPQAATLYSRAAELDPGNAAALLGLAGIRERHGDYPAAAAALEPLVAASPADAEGRLRLGVTLARLERAEEAETHLRLLVEAPAASPDWVFSLAGQELARLLIDRDDLEAAAELLEAMIERLPADPTLPILLAYVGDRQGSPSRKSDLSESLRRGAAAAASSPRYRYSQMPRRALEELRLMLRGESAAQLATLARAISGESMVATAGSR